MNNLSPKAEPIAWGTITGLVIAVAASYGLNVTPELKELLILVVPILAGALWARFRVYAPATVEKIANQQYAAGTPPTQPQPEVPPPAQA